MGFSVLRILRIFGSVFRFFAIKNRGFSVLVSCAGGLRVFPNLVFVFRFLSTIMAVFRIFLSYVFYGFSGFAKEVTPCSRAKTVIPRDLLYNLLPRLSFRGIHDKRSLFSSRYLGRNGCQAD